MVWFLITKNTLDVLSTVLFGDDQTAKHIMDTDNPKEQKALGRQVKSFDAKVWNEQCRDIVEKGNVAKVISN